MDRRKSVNPLLAFSLSARASPAQVNFLAQSFAAVMVDFGAFRQVMSAFRSVLWLLYRFFARFRLGLFSLLILGSRRLLYLFFEIVQEQVRALQNQRISG